MMPFLISVSNVFILVCFFTEVLLSKVSKEFFFLDFEHLANGHACSKVRSRPNRAQFSAVNVFGAKIKCCFLTGSYVVLYSTRHYFDDDKGVLTFATLLQPVPLDGNLFALKLTNVFFFNW